jgi:hypothetical protein
MRSTCWKSAASCSSGRPDEALYEGMIIGENAKPDDLEVNPMKAKQLSQLPFDGQGRRDPPDPAEEA